MNHPAMQTLAQILEEQERDYERSKGFLVRLSEVVNQRVTEALNNKDDLVISPVGGNCRVLTRVKEWESLRPKLEDGRADNWFSCSDLIGTKIIVASTIELDHARRLVSLNLNPSPSKERNWFNTDGRSRGYSGIHWQIPIDGFALNPDDIRSLKGIKTGTELQLLTELQHAWDLVTHDKFYKAETGVPLDIRKRLLRVAAALELLDEEMKSSRERLQQSVSTIYQTIENNPTLDEVSLLTASLHRRIWKDGLERLRILGDWAGFRPSDWTELVRIGPEMDFFLAACNSLGFRNINDLDKFLTESFASKYKSNLRNMTRSYATEHGTNSLFNRPLNVLLVLLLFHHPQLSGQYFKPEITRAVRRERNAIAETRRSRQKITARSK
jgi:ppGpp synthetase/RelA/SpoT-type nucleotidyltranferase